MGKERKCARSVRMGEPDEGRVKRLMSSPTVVVRRSKRKLVEEDEGEEQGFAEFRPNKSSKVEESVSEETLSSEKRRNEVETGGGCVLQSYKDRLENASNETDWQEDQGYCDVAKVKRRQKGFALELMEDEQGHGDARKLSISSRTGIGYSRVKRPKSKLEAGSTASKDVSYGVSIGLGRNSSMVQSLVQVEGSVDFQEAEEVIELRDATMSADEKRSSRRGPQVKSLSQIDQDTKAKKTPQIRTSVRGIRSADAVPPILDEGRPGSKQRIGQQYLQSLTLRRLQKEGARATTTSTSDAPLFPVKKKRGRPKKIKPAETVSDPTVFKRKGGRPKKVKNSAEIMNGLKVLSVPLKEEATGQLRVHRSRKGILESHVQHENIEVLKLGKEVGQTPTIVKTKSCGSNSEGKICDFALDGNCTGKEYQVKHDMESRDQSELEDSWGGSLPPESPLSPKEHVPKNFEVEVPSTEEIKEPSVRLEDHCLEHLPTSQGLSTGEEMCSICYFAGADELMLLCDEGGCKCALHTFCLNPPLKSIPEGEWLCPHCTDEKANQTGYKRRTKRCSGARFPPKVVKEIVGRRTEPFSEVGKSSGSTKVQYLVKWDALSHHHDSWVPEDWLLFMDNRMVFNFQRKNPLSSEINANVDQRCPTWSVADRIIGCRYRGGKLDVHISELSALYHSKDQEKMQLFEFLVKWQGLDYKSATWEDANDSEQTQQAISSFISRHEKWQNSNRLENEEKAVASSIKQQPDYISGGIMYGFQLQGLKWLLSNFEQGRNVILADEMGLGKTIQTLAFISCVRSERLSYRPVLIIAPKSTLPGWEQELRFWAPGLNAIIYHGDKENRSVIQQYEFYRESKEPLFEVLVTSYELATFDNPLLCKFHWASIIVDEGHRVKNVRSKLGTFLKRHTSDFRLLLTGTPVQNTLTELFALLHFLDPTEFPDSENSARGFTEIDVHSNATETSAEGVQQQVSRIHELLRPRMLRRLKSEVLSEMIPGKKLVEVSCALTSFQRHLYVAILRKNYVILKKGVKSGLKRSLNTVLTDLKMVCNHPYLIPGKEPQQLGSPEGFKLLVEASGKLQLLEKLLPLLKKEGHRVLLFAQMTKMLDILEDFLGFLGLSYCRIDGSRHKCIADFNAANSSTFAFLISTQAGGLGISLPSADTVIIFDPDFYPLVDIQAQARAHRIGQEKVVLVYQLVTKFSVEEKILHKSRQKLAMEDLVMGAGLKGTAAEINAILLHGVQKILDDHNLEETSIKFTDENVKKLLNREISSSTPNCDEVQAHGYLGMVPGPEYMSGNIEQERLNSKGMDGTEWRDLLANLAEQDEEEELGRGKRVRKKVMYEIEAEGQEDDEYNPSGDSESSSNSDLSVDSEGLSKKAAKKMVDQALGGVQAVDFASRQKRSGPVPCLDRIASTSGYGLSGASASVSPLPLYSPIIASKFLERGFSPPMIGRTAKMMFPLKSKEAASFNITEASSSGSAAVMVPISQLVHPITSAVCSGFFGSPFTNPSDGVLNASGQVSTGPMGLPPTTAFAGAGVTGSHSQSFHKPFVGLYPYTHSFGRNISTHSYTATSFPGIAYSPYKCPPFVAQPSSSQFSVPDRKLPAANTNTTSNSNCAFSSLQQAIHGWRTTFDSKQVAIPAVTQIGLPGGVSSASGNHGSTSNNLMSKCSSTKNPQPSSTLSPLIGHGAVAAHHSFSKLVNNGKLGDTSLCNAAAAPWLAGYCTVPANPSSQVDPKSLGTPPILLSTLPLDDSTVSVVSGYMTQVLPSISVDSPAALKAHHLTTVPPVVSTPDLSRNVLTVEPTLLETRCSTNLIMSSNLVNTTPAPVSCECLVGECILRTQLKSPVMSSVMASSSQVKSDCCCAVLPREAPSISFSTSPSYQGKEDSMYNPRGLETLSRKASLPTSGLSKLSFPVSTNNFAVPATKSRANAEDSVFAVDNVSSLGDRSSVVHCQLSSSINGEQYGETTEKHGILEQSWQPSRSLPVSKPQSHGRKPLWVPKGDAGLLMGHSQEYGGTFSSFMKLGERSTPEDCHSPLDPHTFNRQNEESDEM